MQNTLSTPAGFQLPLVAKSHGWYDLAPLEWDANTETLRFITTSESGPVSVSVQQQDRVLRLKSRAAHRLSPRERAEVKATARRMLRLDEDLIPFWDRCARVPRLAWVARRKAGRVLASPTLFEDLAKLLFTTNCSWAATRRMNANLLEALGQPAPGPDRAFPAPASVAARPEAFYREVVRVGYRAAALVELAQRFVDADAGIRRIQDPLATTDEMRAELLSWRGFGPYAAGQALRLLGRHDDLALDSWCRAKVARLLRRKKPPADSAIERRYRSFGSFRGLALWMDLTADWHGEGPLTQAEPLG